MLCYPAVEKPLVHRREVERGGCVYMCVHGLVPATLHKAVMGP